MARSRAHALALVVVACTGDPAAVFVPAVAAPPVSPPDETSPEFEPPRLAPAERVEITMQRLPCTGSAVDEVRLTSDGAVTYTGSAHVPFLGTRTGRLPPVLVDVLARHARDTDYFGAADQYEGERGDPVIVTSLTIDGRRKSVQDHGQSAPSSVRAFEWMISAALALTDWGPPPPDDERSLAVRHSLCVAARAELARGVHSSGLHLSPLGRWPPWGVAGAPVCIDTRWPVSPPSAPPRIAGLREVTLERTSCHGDCAVYEVRLRADGRVYFRGVRHTMFTGVQLGWVSPLLVDLLAVVAVETGYPAAALDHGGRADERITSLALADSRKWTTSSGGEVPAAITGFEEAIDAVALLTAWDPPVPAAASNEPCEPVVAAARARCGELMNGAGPLVACEQAYTLTMTGERGTSAGCDYLTSVIDPRAPSAAPPVLTRNCQQAFAGVRERCLDPLGTDVSPASPCLSWFRELADVVHDPHDSDFNCDKLNDEIRSVQARRPRP